MSNTDISILANELNHIAYDIRYSQSINLPYTITDAELLEECADILKNMPSKKGTWIRKPDLDDESYGCYCSICDKWFNNRDWFVTYKYCPNCGNKMNGKIVMEDEYLGDE